MERPPSPPQPPKQAIVRGYKFAWRILLISNLALGAYIFTRPRKKEAARKDKKPSVVHSASDYEEAATTPPVHEPEKIPVSESQWSKAFKW